MDCNVRDNINGALSDLGQVIKSKGKEKYSKAIYAMKNNSPLDCKDALQALNPEFGETEFSLKADLLMDRAIRALRIPALRELAKRKRN